MNPSSARLRASTIEIDDPGSLLDFLTPNDAAFVRGTDGFVALGDIARCSVGSAAEIDAWWADLAGRIEHETEMPGVFGKGPLLLASLPFAPDSARRPFAIVPETIIGRRNGRSWLTVIGRDRVVPTLPDHQPKPEAPTGISYEPHTRSTDEWMARVDDVIGAVREGQFTKMIMARDERATASAPIDPRWVLQRLVTNQGRSWAYLIDGLVGSSPELMIHRRDGLTTSRVVAGTLPRVDGMSEHRQVAQLITSGGDLAEHRMAVQRVRTALARYFSALHVPEAPFVLTLPSILQLTTDIVGVSPGEHSTLAMMDALHAVGAVGGVDASEVFGLLACFEAMDRGRYAGPIGWMDAQGDGDWTNAMTCGQLDADGASMRLFAGSSVGADSSPHTELVETEAKLAALKSALAS